MFSAFDTRMMSRALVQARRGRHSARPNPHVGCVLTRDEVVIGEGFTQPAGGNHAEVQALAAAGDASGATAYVTLEPCSHTGRTGPCTQALINAGVTRVVAALEDPNPRVAGQGLSQLAAAGIEVQSGLLAAEARAMIPGFLLRMTQGRPRVRAKMAMSLDGRTAMASGESQWITGPAARGDVQRLRAASCAIVTGVDTVLADDCSLTVRESELGLEADEARLALAHPPLRVVLDSRLRTPGRAKVVSGQAPTLLCHADDADTTVAAYAEGVSLLSLPRESDGLDLRALLAALADLQCNEVLIEAGASVVGSFLRAELLDELVVYMAPTLLGDRARPLLTLPLERMSQQRPLDITDVSKVGNDWRFTCRPVAL